MLKLEKARVKELEGQMKQMSVQLDQHEMALHQQMEQQRLRWKSEIVSSNSMLNTVGRVGSVHRECLNVVFFLCLTHEIRQKLGSIAYLHIFHPTGGRLCWL